MIKTYKCNEIELIDTEMGLQVEFNSLDGDQKKYFLIQKHFEDIEEFNAPVYIELYHEEISGHYNPKVNIGKHFCIFEFGDNKVRLNYDISEEKLKELKRFLTPLAIVKEV